MPQFNDSPVPPSLDERTAFIYALVDPRDGSIRYVGKTESPKRRLREHLRGDEPSPHKDHWLAQLRREGLVPELAVLEACALSEWKERERAWEIYLRGEGESLTNLRECGDGPVGYCSSPAFREKMRAVLAKQRASSDWASARDYTGQRFGRLTAVEKRPYCARTQTDRRCHWRCRCDCGAEKTVQLYSLLQGATQSCGCLGREALASGMFRKHGHCYTREYKIWTGLRMVCDNPGHKHYAYYGGRGIKVCGRWQAFEQFLADVGESPTPKHLLGRVDKTGHYEPSNCRWMTRSELMTNSRGCHQLTIDGVTRSLTEWAQHAGVSPSALAGRLRDGWDPAEAVGTPALRHWRDRKKS
jgi:hypothetical protein